MASQKQGGGQSRGGQRVRDVMTPDPKCVTPKDTVRDVARIMMDADTGAVPVVENNKVIGMITDRDIVVRLVAEGRDPGKASVRDAMTDSIRTVQDDTTVDDVMSLMSTAQIRRVPVVNAQNELVGIVSLADLAVDTGERKKVGETVTDISQPGQNTR